MQRNYLFVIVLIVTLMSCTQTSKKIIVTDTVNESFADSSISKVNEAYKNIAFDSKRDFICGMPITAGVSDTAHFNDKVYGFCSKECKDEFIKNPASYVAAAK